MIIAEFVNRHSQFVRCIKGSPIELIARTENIPIRYFTVPDHALVESILPARFTFSKIRLGRTKNGQVVVILNPPSVDDNLEFMGCPVYRTDAGRIMQSEVKITFSEFEKDFTEEILGVPV